MQLFLCHSSVQLGGVLNIGCWGSTMNLKATENTFDWLIDVGGLAATLY